jgi:hypothetical protein
MISMTYEYLQSLKKNSLEAFNELLTRIRMRRIEKSYVNYGIVRAYAGPKIRPDYIDLHDSQVNFILCQKISNRKPITLENTKADMNDLVGHLQKRNKM